jgi:hypothetical protein
MVSEKTIIVLVTLAILLSAVSIIVTVNTLNSEQLPDVINVDYVLPDSEQADVGVGILPQGDSG